MNPLRLLPTRRPSETSPSHHRKPRRPVILSTVATFGLTASVVGIAAVTLANGTPPPPAATAAPSSSASTATELAPPAEVVDVRGVDPRLRLAATGDYRLDAIPTAALAAYQRSESVLRKADRACHLDWTLIAAVGQIVSAHGERDGSTYNKNGVLRPAMVGRPVRNNLGKRLADSDAGRLDGDKSFDRAVGPMQLAPTTWSVVGVDADGDGKRNPQDVDDASLAVAVLLCSGKQDLRDAKQLKQGVRRVNDDPEFVSAVIDAARSFRTQLKAAPDLLPTTVPASTVPVELPDYDPPRQVDPTDEPSDPVTLDPKTTDDPSEGPSDVATWEPPDTTDPAEPGNTTEPGDDSESSDTSEPSDTSESSDTSGTGGTGGTGESPATCVEATDGADQSNDLCPPEPATTGDPTTGSDSPAG